MPAEGVSLGALFIELGLDASSFYADLEKARVDALNAAKDIRFKINIDVDHKSLKSLNDHLTLKERHIDRLNQKVIKPKVDLSQIRQARSEIGSLFSDQSRTLTVNVVQKTTKVLSEDAETGLQKSVDRVFTKAVEGSLKKGAGGIGGSLFNPLNLVGNVLSIPQKAIGGIAQGLVQGVTYEVSRNLGKGLSTALETSVSSSFGSTELIGEKLGGKLGGALTGTFTGKAKILGNVLESQISKIDDKKLRKKLQDMLSDVKALPEGVKLQAQDLIGQDNIREEGLATRGKARARIESRKPIAREQAAVEWRESIDLAERVESQATARIQKTNAQIKEKTKEFKQLSSDYNNLEQEISSLQISGASSDVIESLAKEFKGIGEELKQVSDELETLQSVKATAERALSEVQTKPTQARETLESVSPKQQPKAYQDLAKAVLGDNYDEDKLPSLAVGDAYLKQQNAGSIYQTARNRILVTTEMAEAIMKGTLSPEQAKILGEELAHAEDFDFGSYEGIQAAKNKTPIGRRVEPTQEELELFTPELGRYVEEERQKELNAKVKGYRGAQNYLQQQDQQSRINRVSTLAVEGDKQALKKGRFVNAVNLLEEVGNDKGSNITESLGTFIDQYKEALAQIRNLSNKAASQAKTMSDAELAELETEMKKAIIAFDNVYVSLKDEIKQVATTGKTTKQTQALAVTEKQPKNNKEKAVEIAQKAGEVARKGFDAASKGASNLAVVFNQIPMEGIKQNAIKTAYGLGVAAKAVYKVASVAESVALDLIPMGRTIKGVTQHTVLPAAAFMGASALIPGVGGVGAMAAHGLAGALMPAGHAMAGSVGGAVGGMLPNVMGFSGAVTASVTGAVDAAITGAIPAIATGVTAVMGGKVLGNAVGKPLQAIPKPSNLAALPPSQQKSSELALVDKRSEQITQAASNVRKSAIEGAKKAGELTAEAVKTFQELDRKIKQVKYVYKTVEQMLKAGNVEFAESMLTDLKSKAQEARANINLFRIGEGSDTLSQGSYGSKLANRQSQLKKQEKKIETLESRIRRMKPDEDRSGAFDIQAAHLKGYGSDLESQNLLKHIKPEHLEDLAVNSAGFLASIVGGQHGTVGALAGDLGGALVARQAITVGKAGVGAYKGLSQDEAFKQATKSQQFKMFVKALHQQLQDAAVQQALGNNITGDVAGFAIGNAAASLGSMIPEIGGIPMKGAAVAMATVPQLQKLRQQIQSTLSQSASSGMGGDLESANLTGIKRQLSKVQIDILKNVEMTISRIISAVDNVGADDVSASKFREEMRSLNNVNKTIERLLQHRSEIIDDVFTSEMEKRNQELLEIGRRVQNKVDKTDPDLIAARGISNETIKQGRSQETSNIREIRANRRLVNQQEREGVGFNPELVRVENNVKQEFGLGIIGNIRKLVKGINEDFNNALLKKSEQLRIEAKTLLNDITTARIVAQDKGDTDQAKKLGGLERGLSKAVSTSERFEGLKGADVSPDQIKRLKDANKVIVEIAEKLDKPIGADGFGKFPGIFGKIANGAKLAIGAFVGFQAIQIAQQYLGDFIRTSLDAAMAMDRMQTALNFGLGGVKQGAEGFEFVKATVKELGIPLNAALEGYKQLAVAGKSLGVSNGDVQATFTGVSKAATVLGLSADDTQGIFLALQQVMSKGKVQAEELRGQIGERLPGAFSMAARAMGVSEQELNKMMETGQVMSKDFIPKFAKQLEVEFGGSAVDASNNAQSAMFKFQNQVQLTQAALGKMAQPAQMAFFNTMSSALELLTNNFDKLVMLVQFAGIALATKFLPPLIASLSAGMVANAGTLGTAILGIGKSAMTAGLAMASSLVIPTAIFAGIQLVTEGMRYLIPDETTKESEKLTDGLLKGLKDVEEAAKKARGEIENIPDPKDKKPKALVNNPVEGYLNYMFRQNVFGEEVNSPTKDAQGKYTGFRTGSEQQYNKQLDSAMRGTDKARELFNNQLGKSQLFGSNIPDVIAGLKEQDANVRTLQSRKQTALGQPQQDKQLLADIDKQINSAVEARNKMAEPLIKQRQTITKQIAGIDAAIEANNKKYGEGTEEAETLNNELKAQKGYLQQSLTVLDHFDKELGQAVDPARALSIAFEKMNTDLEELERRVNKTFNQNRLSISQNQLNGFGTNKFNSTETSVKNSENELNRAKELAAETERITNEMKGRLNDPINKQALAGVTDSSGKQIGEESSKAELNNAKKRLKDGDVRKDMIDQILAYKENVGKLDDLRNQAVQSQLQLKEAIQQDALAKIEDKAANRNALKDRAESLNQLASAQENAAIRSKKAALTLEQARNKINPEEAAVKQADLGIAEAKNNIKVAERDAKLAQVNLANIKQQRQDTEAAFKAGKISAEEYNKRIRDLKTQEVQAYSQAGIANTRVTESQAAAQEAVAEKIRAVNEQMKEQLAYQVRMREAAIKLKETQATTENRGVLLDANAGELTKAQVEASQGLINVEASQERIANLKSEIAGVQELAAKGAITQKEATERIAQLQQNIAEQEQSIQEARIQSYERLRQSQLELEKAVFEEAQDILKYQEQRIDLVSKELDLTQKINQSRAEVLKSQMEVAEGVLKNSIDILDMAHSASKELDGIKGVKKDDETVKQTTQQSLEMVIKNIGQYLGKSLGSTDDILIQKQQMEDDLAKQQAAMMEADFKLEQENLKIQNAQAQLQARLVQIQAQSLRLQAEEKKMNSMRAKEDAKIAVGKAQADLKQAQASGDSTLIEIAANNLRAAQNKAAITELGDAQANRAIDIADRTMQFAEKNIVAIDEMAKNSIEALANKQLARANEFNAREFMREQGQTMTLGKEGIDPTQNTNAGAVVRVPQNIPDLDMKPVINQIRDDALNSSPLYDPRNQAIFGEAGARSRAILAGTPLGFENGVGMLPSANNPNPGLPANVDKFMQLERNVGVMNYATANRNYQPASSGLGLNTNQFSNSPMEFGQFSKQLERLNDNIETLADRAATPKNLTVISKDPSSDAGKIYSDINNIKADASRI